MTSFQELQQAYGRDPQEVFDLISKLEPQARLDLLLNNLSAGKRANKVKDDEKNLPAVYRKVGVRWNYYGNLLTFDQQMLTHHIEPHLPLEVEGSDYIANTLGLLIWKAMAEPADAPALK